VYYCVSQQNTGVMAAITTGPLLVMDYVYDFKKIIKMVVYNE
jgi:hypothetical protein